MHHKTNNSIQVVLFSPEAGSVEENDWMSDGTPVSGDIAPETPSTLGDVGAGTLLLSPEILSTIAQAVQTIIAA